MKEDEPLAEEHPIVPKNPEVVKILYGELDDNSLRKRGFNPREVSNWGLSLFKGEVPKGFSTLEEFEEHLLSVSPGKKNKPE